jgi:hypothetical protein
VFREGSSQTSKPAFAAVAVYPWDCHSKCPFNQSDNPEYRRAAHGTVATTTTMPKMTIAAGQSRRLRFNIARRKFIVALGGAFGRLLLICV